jgi:hypothetical protein
MYKYIYIYIYIYINEETLELNINQNHLIYICRIFHPTTVEHTFFSTAYGTFSKIYHILGHNSNLNKYKKIELTLVFYQIIMEQN